MGLALDEQKEDDEVLNEKDFSLVIEKKLLRQIGGVAIDFRKNRWMGSGFVVSPLHGGGGSCC